MLCSKWLPLIQIDFCFASGLKNVSNLLLNKFQIFVADPGMPSLEGQHSALRYRGAHGMRRLTVILYVFFDLTDVSILQRDS